MTTAEILQDIKSSVLAVEPGATVILYGSYARGEEHIDSDIDILVLVDKDKITFEDRKRIGAPLYSISVEADKVIAPIIVAKAHWGSGYRKYAPFYKNVVREGVLL